MSESLQNVDHAALKVNQLVIIVLNIVAFVLNLWWLAAIVTFFMALGTAIGRPGFFFVYQGVLRPLKLVKPEVHADNPQPHRFAQGFGAVVLLIGTLLLVSGAAVAGWALVWLVVFLAALNAFAGFCAGCFVYYQLGKLNLPGFGRRPPQGTFPGLKPRTGPVEHG